MNDDLFFVIVVQYRFPLEFRIYRPAPFFSTNVNNCGAYQDIVDGTLQGIYRRWLGFEFSTFPLPDKINYKGGSII